MVKINLLPHREARRKERKTAFFAMLILSAFASVLLVMLGGFIISARISAQNERNAFIEAENTKLDVQIKEIASLKQEIEALKARQQAVEDLQGDRNQPVYLMDELVKQVPEGIYLKGFKQTGQKVLLNGYAQSNERVSELLRNLGNASPWLEHPELLEIKAATVGQGKEARRVFEFSMNVGIRRPRDKETGPAAPNAANAVAAAATPGKP
ncbi:PilN domain-containing protein [Noviherbaspirillum pedocola]|uniref:PilN domain-containing protein n=1 Tax=Noviherbaspirillum pedocola TaxID=2801341 RepID=A0A934SNT7_9BURK|nr:PilN domain-containing protein [Noviherbaspirillum pedocola]MBK4733860.1 PilN domain-containing protein [Noviherbaspirillum pedocola]